MIEIPASHMETSTDDVDMLSSPPASIPNIDHASVTSQCADFQSRIDWYKQELNRTQSENQDIYQKLCDRDQEDRRHRLIDSASSEPRAALQEETKEMVVKNANKRRRQLRGQLDQVKEGMKALQVEMDAFREEMDAHGQ